jgi:hypothetical protein
MTLDVDVTDDPLHSNQNSPLFREYYGCYRHLPLSIFCG